MITAKKCLKLKVLILWTSQTWLQNAANWSTRIKHSRIPADILYILENRSYVLPWFVFSSAREKEKGDVKSLPPVNGNICQMYWIRNPWLTDVGVFTCQRSIAIWWVSNMQLFCEDASVKCHNCVRLTDASWCMWIYTDRVWCFIATLFFVLPTLK